MTDIQLRSFHKDLLLILRAYPISADETTQVDIIVILPGNNEITTLSVNLRRRKTVDTLRDDLKAYLDRHQHKSADDIRMIVQAIREKEATLF